MTLPARTPAPASPLPADVASLSHPQLQDAYSALRNGYDQLHARVTQLQSQLAWFQNQLFGRKSEQRFVDGESRQLSLGEGLGALPETPKVETIDVRYARPRTKGRMANAVSEEGLRFDPGVPVQETRLEPPQIKDLTADHYEVIGEHISHRLAQRPGSYVVIKYVRPVIKRKATMKEETQIVTAPAPGNVLDHCAADVSVSYRKCGSTSLCTTCRCTAFTSA